MLTVPLIALGREPGSETEMDSIMESIDEDGSGLIGVCVELLACAAALADRGYPQISSSFAGWWLAHLCLKTPRLHEKKPVRDREGAQSCRCPSVALLG